MHDQGHHNNGRHLGENVQSGSEKGLDEERGEQQIDENVGDKSIQIIRPMIETSNQYTKHNEDIE